MRRSIPGAVARGLLPALLALAAVPAALAQAGDVAIGRQKAAACAVCHGPLGLANAPETPSLAGQPAGYLAAQLKAFRSGARRHEVMAVIAKPLSDEDIAHLSAWYAALQVSVTPP